MAKAHVSLRPFSFRLHPAQSSPSVTLAQTAVDEVHVMATMARMMPARAGSPGEGELMKTRVWVLGAVAALVVAFGAAPRALAADPPANGADAKPQGPYVVVVGVGEVKDTAIKPRPTADADV